MEFSTSVLSVPRPVTLSVLVLAAPGELPASVHVITRLWPVNVPDTVKEMLLVPTLHSSPEPASFVPSCVRLRKVSNLNVSASVPVLPVVPPPYQVPLTFGCPNE